MALVGTIFDYTNIADDYVDVLIGDSQSKKTYKCRIAHRYGDTTIVSKDNKLSIVITPVNREKTIAKVVGYVNESKSPFNVYIKGFMNFEFTPTEHRSVFLVLETHGMPSTNISVCSDSYRIDYKSHYHQEFFTTVLPNGKLIVRINGKNIFYGKVDCDRAVYSNVNEDGLDTIYVLNDGEIKSYIVLDNTLILREFDYKMDGVYDEGDYVFDISISKDLNYLYVLYKSSLVTIDISSDETISGDESHSYELHRGSRYKIQVIDSHLVIAEDKSTTPVVGIYGNADKELSNMINHKETIKFASHNNRDIYSRLYNLYPNNEYLKTIGFMYKMGQFKGKIICRKTV